MNAFNADDIPDRRRTRRYPIRLDLEFAVIGAGTVTTGAGKVVDISSDSIRFVAGSPLPVGETLISLSLAWPVAGADGARQKLRVWGQVQRRTGNEIVVRFGRYAIQRR